MRPFRPDRPDHQSIAGMLAWAQAHLRERQAILYQVRCGNSIGWTEAYAEELVRRALDTLWYAQENMRRFLS